MLMICLHGLYALPQPFELLEGVSVKVSAVLQGSLRCSKMLQTQMSTIAGLIPADCLVQAAVAAARPRTNDELDHAYEAAMSHLKMDSLKGIAADRHHYAKCALDLLPNFSQPG